MKDRLRDLKFLDVDKGAGRVASHAQVTEN
jgi:hypothetical protein